MLTVALALSHTEICPYYFQFLAHFEDLSVRVLLENVSNGHVQWRILDTEILAIRVIARHGAHKQRRVISFSINTESVLSLQMIGLSECSDERCGSTLDC